VAGGTVTVRDLATGEQTSVAATQAVSAICAKLA